MNNRKIILNLATTLDGYIEGPNKEYDWCFTDQDYGFTDFLSSIDTIFMGRKSYELVKDMIDKQFPNNKIVVFSKTLKDDRVTIISDNIKQEIEKIKAEPGKNIWMFGGAQLTETFIDLQLIDEIQMAIHPLLIGSGTPLFHKRANKIQLELLNNQEFSSGLVLLKYRVKY